MVDDLGEPPSSLVTVGVPSASPTCRMELLVALDADRLVPEL